MFFEEGKERLTKNKKSKQTQYLLNYLQGLNVKRILIEPNYFDRDYLSEFSSFYSTSVYGYKNICQRFHFFSDDNIDRAFFEKAVGGDKKSIRILSDNYLGFCVLRPIQTQFGQTVLKWYENKGQTGNRLTVRREYVCHVAGVELKIEIKQENNCSYPVLHLKAPKYSQFQETDNYQIIPKALVVATYNEIRTSPDQLHFTGLNVVLNLYNILQYIIKNKDVSIQLSLSTRFIKLTDYVHIELNRLLGSNSENLSQTRLALWEKVRPMSLHLGLVRIGLAKSSIPLVDVLYDTTDSNIQAFDYITFKKEIDDIIKAFKLNFDKSI